MIYINCTKKIEKKDDRWGGGIRALVNYIRIQCILLRYFYLIVKNYLLEEEKIRIIANTLFLSYNNL